MKICLLVQNLFTLGGIQRVVTTILNELVKNSDFEITVIMPFQMKGRKLFNLDNRVQLNAQEDFCEDRTHKPVRYLLAANKRLGFLDQHFLVKFVERIRFSNKEKARYIEYFNKENFDVVIGAGIEYSLLLGTISSKIKAKTIGWQHSTFDSYFTERGSNGYGINKYCKTMYTKLDDVWVLTDSDKKDFDLHFGLNSRVFHNPISQHTCKMSKHETGNILFVGRLVIKHKGLDYLIDIMRYVAQSVPDSILTIVGDGPAHDWMKKEIRKRGLEKNIELVGNTNNVYKYYEKAAVMLQTSRWEGFGMTIIEAMSCGIPVVAYHNYGPDEIIRNGIDGFLIDHYEIEEFAQKVIALLNDRNLCERLGENGMERAKVFSIEKLLPVFISYLQDIVER